MRVKIAWPDALWGAGAGTIAGVGSAVLTKLGNPVDGGISIACFCRDIAGSLGLHQTLEFSYLRPELAAMALGAGALAILKKEFQPTGGSSTMLRFVIGMIVAFGVFAFIGCPMRVGLRLAGGDPAALAGLAGLVAGVGMGSVFLAQGFALGKSPETTRSNGLAFHGLLAVLLVLLAAKPAFVALTQGRHSPLLASLAIGALVGIAGQHSKICFTGGFRNFFLIGDLTLLSGFVSLVISAMIANLALGQAHFGVHLIGSADTLWSFIALCVVGLGSTFLGGCPFRQLIMASQGNTDSAVTIAGLTAGAAIAYNADLAFTAESLDKGGELVVAAGLVLLVLIGLLNLKRS